MAITATSAITNNANQTAQASFSGVISNADVLPGDLMVVGIAADNAGAAGISAISSVTDSQGHTWTAVKVQNRTAANAANDGCTAALYTARCTKRLAATTDTVTVNFSPNVTAKSFQFIALRGVEDIAYSTNGVGGTGTTYNSGATATASLASGDVVIGVVASESNTQPTGDADATNGAWVAASQGSGGGGGDATKMSVSLQYKIVTGAGTQTLNGTAANSDWAVAWGLFTVPVTKSDTEASTSSVEAESVNTGAQPSDTESGTAVDVDVSIAQTATAADAETGTADDSGAPSIGVADFDGTILVNLGYCQAAGGTASTNATGGAGGAGFPSSSGDFITTGGAGGDGFTGAGSAGGGGGGASGGTVANGADGSPGTALAGGAGGVPGTGGVQGQPGGYPPTLSGLASGTAGGSGGSGSSAVGAGSGVPNAGGFARFTYSPSGTVRTYSPASPAGSTHYERPPAGDTSVVIETYGGGGGSANAVLNTRGSGGGGGGAYAKTTHTITYGGTSTLFVLTFGAWNISAANGSTTTVDAYYPSETDHVTEAGAISVPFSDAETGAAVDAEAIAVAASDAEVAAGADAGEALADTLTDDDPGTTGEGAESIAAVLSDPESGTGADGGEDIQSSSSGTPITDADAGSGGEAGTIDAALTDADTASDAEAGFVAAEQAVTDDDPATSGESASIVAALAAVEDGTGDEDGVIAAALADAESGVGVDLEVLAAAVNDSDVAVSAEDASVFIVTVVFVGGHVRVVRNAGGTRVHWTAQGKSGVLRVGGSTMPGVRRTSPTVRKTGQNDDTVNRTAEG